MRKQLIKTKRAKKLIQEDWKRINWWNKHQPDYFKSFEKDRSIQNNEEGC